MRKLTQYIAKKYAADSFFEASTLLNDKKIILMGRLKSSQGSYVDIDLNVLDNQVVNYASYGFVTTKNYILNQVELNDIKYRIQPFYQAWPLTPINECAMDM